MAQVDFNFYDGTGKVYVDPGSGSGDKSVKVTADCNCGQDRVVNLRVAASSLNKQESITQIGVREQFIPADQTEGMKGADGDYFLGIKEEYADNMPLGCMGGVIDSILPNLVLWYNIRRQGCTNESMAGNPVLKDLSGNGHDATCYNFGWKGMSGIGGYGFPDLNTWIKNTAVVVDVINPNKVTLSNSSGTGGIRQGFSENTTLKLHISNIDNDSHVLIYRMHGGGVDDELLYTITEEGDYVIDLIYNPDDTYNMVLLSGLATFEQLPLYPNALVSDGVDDYCLVEGLPILTKENGYTVIAKRKWFTNQKITALASKCSTTMGDDGAFQFEHVNGSANNFNTASFSSNSSILNLFTDEISIVYQTLRDYNGQKVLSIKENVEDTDKMVFFRFSTTKSQYYGKLALWSFVLFNRDLTAEEIEAVKRYMI